MPSQDANLSKRFEVVGMSLFDFSIEELVLFAIAAPFFVGLFLQHLDF